MSAPAVARHPDSLTTNTALEVAAAAVLLHEGVEGGEELGRASSLSMSGLAGNWAVCIVRILGER